MHTATSVMLAVSDTRQGTTGYGGGLLLLIGLVLLAKGKSKSGGGGILIGLLLLWAAMHGSSDTSTPVTPNRPPAVTVPHRSATPQHRTTQHRSTPGTGDKHPAPKQSCLLICGITTN